MFHSLNNLCDLTDERIDQALSIIKLYMDIADIDRSYKTLIYTHELERQVSEINRPAYLHLLYWLDAADLLKNDAFAIHLIHALLMPDQDYKSVSNFYHQHTQALRHAIELFSRFMAYGHDGYRTIYKRSNSPLHDAIDAGVFGYILVKMLIANHANPRGDYDNFTPLDYAVSRARSLARWPRSSSADEFKAQTQLIYSESDLEIISCIMADLLLYTHQDVIQTFSSQAEIDTFLLRKLYNLKLDSQSRWYVFLTLFTAPDSSSPSESQIREYNGYEHQISTYQDALQVYPDRIALPLLEPIGKGAYGSVYRTIFSNEEMAIKISNGDTDDADIIYEAGILAKLYHPNIIKFILQIYPEGSGSRAFLMEYANLGSLLTFVNALPQTEATYHLPDFTKQIVSALQYLHTTAKLTHNDLSSRNVLVVSNPAAPHDPLLKLCDFGTSAKVDTMRYGIVTTPNVCAPEAWKDGLYIPANDIFSLACLLGFIATQINAWSEINYNSYQIKYYVTAGKRSIFKGAPIDPPVQKLMNMCWHQDPEQRPAHQQIIEYVDEHLMPNPIVNSP